MRIKYLEIYESTLDGKTIKHAFTVYDEFYIGFTDGSWVGFMPTTDYECGEPQIRDAPDIKGLVDLLDGFQWDIVAEFEKAGIVEDGKELRAELKKRRLAYLDGEIKDKEERLKQLKEQVDNLT